MSSEHLDAVAEPDVDVVLGTVQLMADEPGDPGLRRRLAGQLRRRPWIIPAALMTVVAVLVASRRH